MFRICFAQKFVELMKILAALLAFLCGEVSIAQDWRTADRSSAGLAPSPEEEKRAVVQIYAARTVGWKGAFGVHTWIAVKEKDADTYETLQVIGYRARRGLEVVVVQPSIPDGRWFGAEPELLRDLRGSAAERAIPKIREAAASYPYPNDYRVYPGPNSNTFVSYIIRRTPEIGVELPANAVGKDWINRGALVGVSETRTGFQFSIFGLLGFTLGVADGVEVNILGMTFGVDILRPALKLPMLGRVGMQDKPFLAPDDDQPLQQDHTQPLVVDPPKP